MSRGLQRAGKASRSRLDTPIMGMRRAWAIALPAAMPTRKPVKSPGPTSTATQPMSCRSTRAWRRRKSTAGTSVSAWRLPRLEWTSANTPSCPPMAHPTWRVEVVMPRISTPAPRSRGPVRRTTLARSPRRRAIGRGATCRRVADPLGPRRHRLDQRGHPPQPRAAGAAQDDGALVVAVTEGQPHLEQVHRKHRHDDVAPLDEHDALVVQQLGEAEVGDLAELVQSIDVDVVHGEVSRVLLDQRERGAGDRLG